jgi:hypothetical protein
VRGGGTLGRILQGKIQIITYPSFQNDTWRLVRRGNGSLNSVATVPGPAFKKEAPATMFDRHKILAIQGVQEAVVLNIRNLNVSTFEKTGQLREKSAFGLILCPYRMVRSLSSAVQVSVNNSIQLPSMPRFGIPPLVNGVSLLMLSKLRLYHSTSILLPDATVLVGGRGGR